MRNAPMILVVDDNIDAAEILAELLRMDGHVVVTAHDGLAALAAARRHLPEILLLDISLPGLSGFEVARAVRDERGTSARIAALSGYDGDEVRQRSIDAGCDVHFLKPPDLAELTRFCARKVA